MAPGYKVKFSLTEDYYQERLCTNYFRVFKLLWKGITMTHHTVRDVPMIFSQSIPKFYEILQQRKYPKIID